MNITNVVITPNPQNQVDYNIKCDITNDLNEVIGDFGESGIDVFQWWAQQDEQFRQDIVMQFMWVMAREIMSGAAE